MTIYRSNDEVFAVMDAYEIAHPEDTSAANAFRGARATFAERGTMSLIVLRAFLGIVPIYMAPGPMYRTDDEVTDIPRAWGG